MTPASAVPSREGQEHVPRLAAGTRGGEPGHGLPLLGSYATRHEISVDGPLREYYLRGADEVADEAEWRTEIGWPIFRADGPRGDGASG